jgi:hypothetical protein
MREHNLRAMHHIPEKRIRKSRRAGLTVGVLAVGALSLLAAGCGSNSSSPSANSNSSSPQSFAHMQQDGIAFADCMRSHGVPFPDPTTSPREFKNALNPSTEHSPAFLSAERTCQHLLPGGGPRSQSAARSPAQIAAFLAFARCIRGHGFPSFPDPTSGGDLTHQMVANAGIDLHQPAVLQAGYACVSVTHGYITKTDVARFVAEQ